jgi:hypothetical protein
MATYEDIYGKRVKFFDSDPTLDSTYEGQVWYDSATGVLKSVTSSAVAVSAQAMPTGTRAFGSIGAAQDSFIVACGANPGTNYSTNAFEYDGNGWRTLTSATNTRDQVSRGTCGTVTAGLVFGGTGPSIIRATTELWNGTSWSESGDLSDSRGGGESFGTQTACVTTGGYNDYSPPYWTNATEEFNGSSWTSGTATPLNTNQGCGVGIETAGMIVGQREQPSNSYPSAASVTQTRNYDGTNWSLGGVLNMAANGNFTAGSQTAARKAGGASPAPASYTNTEEWDNTSWTTGPALASDLSNGGGAGTSTAAVYAGGQTPPGNLTTTQEVTKTIGTLTAAAWASGGALNVPRVQTYGAGSQTAGLIFGGEGPPGARNQTEEYNGSTWTEVNNMPAGNKDHAGFGIQTAAVACGGSPTTTSLNYDGTNWTASPGSLNTGRTNSGGTGTQTAGLTFGGHPNITATEEYNGSSWTTNPNALPAARSNIFAAGTQTAALGAGGGPPTSTAVYEYDGSSWTSGNALPSGTIDARGGGTQTDALYAGGYLHPGSGYPTTTLGYDGTNWSTRPSLATATAGGGAGQSAAPASANWIAGGYSPAPSIAVTQEFTGITETVASKTLTTS